MKDNQLNVTPMNNALMVITNMPDVESAKLLTRRLLSERAAACINQLAPCISSYRWQGKIESETEVPLLIKTSNAAYQRLEELIREVHPYELPEIIAVPLAAGLPAYLSWISSETELDQK